MPLERLHKVLAHAGFGSRRACEQFIRDGQVEVDGDVVTSMGVKVDPANNRIRCQGRVVRPPQGTVVLLFHKPRRVVCTVRDDRGRRTVMDFFRAFRERLYPVGRLDAQSQGMLVVTNDGELTNRLTHPRYGVSRTYHVVVEGEVGDAILQRLRRGVWLAEGKTAPIDTIVKKRERRATVLEVTVREGMNREVRRVFAKFGLEVSHLKRIRIGDLPLGSLPEGAYRRLEPSDIELMLRAAKPGPAPPKNRGVRRMGKPSPDLARSEEE